MLLPALAAAKERGKRIACLSNTKQMGLGSQMFADDDSANALTGVCNYADDDQNWLYAYVTSLKAYSCPSTKNEVRDITAPTAGLGAVAGNAKYTGDWTGISYVERCHLGSTYVPDLVTNAGGKEQSYGTSYEVAGWWNSFLAGDTTNPAHTRKTQKNSSSWVIKTTEKPYMQAGETVSISSVWLMYDADDLIAGDPTRKNDNYPDPGDNHGTAGANVVFGDGHSEWVAQKNYMSSFIRGTDEYHDPIQ